MKKTLGFGLALALIVACQASAMACGMHEGEDAKDKKVTDKVAAEE